MPEGLSTIYSNKSNGNYITKRYYLICCPNPGNEVLFLRRLLVHDAHAGTLNIHTYKSDKSVQVKVIKMSFHI